MSNGMSRNPDINLMAAQKSPELRYSGLAVEVEAAKAMPDYPAPKTKDQIILSAFREMTGKSITLYDLELLKSMIAHGARR